MWGEIYCVCMCEDWFPYWEEVKKVKSWYIYFCANVLAYAFELEWCPNVYINRRLVDPSGTSLPNSNNAKLANWLSIGYNAYGTHWVHLLFKLHYHCVCLLAWHGLAFVHFYVGVCVCVSFYSIFFGMVGSGVGKIGTNPGTSKFSDSPKLVCFVLSVLSWDACSIRSW